MIKYECLFTIESNDGKVYKAGECITQEEYSKLPDALKGFFMLGKLEYAF